MAALSNAKHDAIAQAFIRDPQRIGWKAYKAVFPGTSDHAAQTSWSRLLKKAGFRARIEELKAAAADVAVMDLREVLAELSKLGRANMQDFAHIGSSDNVVGDIAELTPEQAAAIQEITVETYLEGRGDDAKTVKRVKFRLHSKPAALAQLREHHEPQRHEHTGKGGGPIKTKDVSEHTPLEVARRIIFALERGRRELAKGTKRKGGK